MSTDEVEGPGADRAVLRARLGQVGIWSSELRFGEPELAAQATAELDALGYGAIWVPGGIGGDLLADIDRLLDASRQAVIATGIINVWKHEPGEVARWWHAQNAERQQRTLLGLGISHGPLIGDDYAQARPVPKMRAYLDDLAAEGVPPAHLCLAALGPKMLDLSATRTAGAHPYLVTPEHSIIARKQLGADALLMPEQGVILETDPDRARTIARAALDMYLKLPNYSDNWLRLGFTEEDVRQVSDRLIDGLFAWGTAEAIAERVQAHHAAGADHVCLQLITGEGGLDAALKGWRELATVLL